MATQKIVLKTDTFENQRVKINEIGQDTYNILTGGVTIENLSVDGYITESTDGGTTYWNVVTQQDVGTAANQVPLNQYLGQLAFLDDFSPNGLRREGGSSDDVVVNASGNVGIGTTPASSTVSLHIGKENTRGILLNNSSIGTSVTDGTYITNSNDGSFGIFNQENSFMRFGTNNTERLRIDSSGNVGIGTTSPSTSFHVNGSGDQYITVTSSNAQKTGIQFGNTSDPDAGGIRYANDNSFRIRTNNAERMRIDSSGNVGIGTSNPSPYGKLVVVDGTLASINSGGNQQLITVANSAITVNLGVYNPYFPASASLTTVGAHPFVFGTNNTERMRIDSSGRVLVGTSTASGTANLQVEGSAAVAQIIGNRTDALGPRLSLGKSRGSSAGSTTIVQSGDEIGQIMFVGADGTDVSSTGASIKGLVDGTPGVNDMPGALTFLTTSDGNNSPTERLRIDSSGNVGIGVVPSYRLHTSIYGSNYLYLDNTRGPASAYIGVLDTETQFVVGGAHPLTFGTNSTERMRITSDGNVGIGTSTPTNAKLEVSNSTNGEEVIRINDSRATPSVNRRTLDIRYTGANGRTANNTQLLYLYDNNASSTKPFMEVENASSSLFVIDSSGNVGIGTSSPTQKLTVASSDTSVTRIQIANSSTGVGATDGLQFSVDGNGYAGINNRENTDLYVSTNNTIRLTVKNNGNVGIGTTTPTQILDVVGNIKTSGSLYGPANFIIDPAAVGDDTGKVIIKGDLQIDGTTTTVNSTTMTVDDKNIELGTGAANDAAADGGGITIVSGDGNKTFNFEATGDNLGSSENLNLASGKEYKINNTSVLSATTLGTGVTGSSLTSVGTLGSLTVSGDVSIADKIVHTGDTNTAVRFPANDTVSVETAGSERMRIDSAGNVGIGTSSPSEKLEIGNSAAGIDNNGTNGQLERIGSFKFGTTSSFGNRGPTASIDHVIRTDNWANQQFSSQIAFSTAENTGGTLTQRAVITNQGYFGVGTTTPSAGIHVNAPASQSPAIFEINTSEAARIDSAGRLLVGTSTFRQFGSTGYVPQILLEGTAGGNSTVGIVRNSANATGCSLSLGKSRATSVGGVDAVSNNDELVLIDFQGADGTGLISAARIQAFVDGTPGTNDMPGRLVFSTTADGASSPTERLRIDSSGNVGIGTSSPSCILDVQGGAGSTIKNLNAQWVGSGTNSTFRTDGVFDFQNTSGTNRLRIDSSGNVGIGVTAAAEKLHVAGDVRIEDNSPRLGFYDANASGIGDATGGIEIFNSSGSRSCFLGATEFANVLSFGTNNSERMRIDSSGNVGIGTSAPGAQLHVNSGTSNTCATFESTDSGAVINITDNNARSSIEQNGSSLKIISDTDAVGASSDIRLQVDGSTKMLIDSSGNVGIGTTTPTQILDVVGNIKTSGSLYGPANFIIDPAAVGDNTGVVRIKGDLYVDGTTTQINSETLTIADFVVGIASTATTDSLADGAGINIGPDNTFKYDHTNTSLKSSENLNVASGKTYKVNGTDVLSATTLGSGVVNSSLTSVGTLTGLTLSGDIYLNSTDKKIFLSNDYDQYITANAASNYLAFAAANQERLRITSTGEVKANGSFLESTDGGTTYWNVVTQQDVGTAANQVPLNQYLGQLAFLDDFSPNGLRRSGGSSDDVVVNASGNIGIGTNNPSYKLQVENSGTTLGRFLRTNAGAGLFQIMSQDGGSITLGLGDVSDPDIQYIKSDNSDNSLSFGTDADERLRITSDGRVRIPDNGKFTAGDDDDLQIYHDGNHSRIIDSGTGSLISQASRFSVHSADDSEVMIDASQNSYVKLYHDNVLRFETTLTGAQVTGELDVNHSVYCLRYGAQNGGGRADNANKEGRLVQQHYTNAEEPLGTIVTFSLGSSSLVNIGGGSSLVNAATETNLYAAANTTTTGGTKILSATSSGVTVTGSLISSGNIDVGNETTGRKTLTLNSADNGAAVLFRADAATRAVIEVPDGQTALVFGVEVSNTPTERLRIDTTGTIVSGNVEPEADATRDLGSATKRWANIYSADLQLSNEGSHNDVDGTWGQYTIQEGEEDLFLINRRSGKKYKFVLKEV